MKTPFLSSAHFKNQVNDAAILIDPDDAKSIMDGIIKIHDKLINE